MQIKHIVRILSIATIFLFVMVAHSFGKSSNVRLAYVEWSSEIASTHLVQAIIQEKMGKTCHILPMEADEMWEAV